MSKHIYPTSQETGSPTPFCPSDDALAAYFDANFDGPEQTALQRHLADCTWCQGRVGMLSRLADEQQVTVDSELLAEAKHLGQNTRTPRWRRAPAWATAAVVFLTAGIWIGQQQLPTPPAAEGLDSSRQVRTIDRPTIAPELLWPVEGAVVSPEALKVRWSGVTGSLHYEVFLLSDAGDLLAHERVEENTWTAPAELKLEPGGEYFVRIEARLPGAGNTSSEHTAFRVKAGD